MEQEDQNKERQVSDSAETKADFIKYNCLSCGTTIDMQIVNNQVPKPKPCPCGKGKWEILSAPLDFSILVYQRSYERITALMRGYLDLPEDYYHLIAIWIIGTYLHASFDTYPFLFVNAMRGSGKTRLLKFISALSNGSEGDVQTGLSEAVLFRTPKGDTLVWDECEDLGSKEKGKFREYLNACYKKGAIVKRTKKVKDATKEDYVIDRFETFRPVAMANINGIEEVLSDRSLWLVLEKSNNQAITKILEDFQTNVEFKSIKDDLKALSVVLCSVVYGQKYVERWNNYIRDRNTTTNTIHYTLNTLLYNTIHEQLSMEEMFNQINKINDLQGRNLEIIFPILIIARTINQDTFELLLRISKDIIKTKKTDEVVESKDVSVLEFVATKGKEYQFDYININQMVGLLKEFLGKNVEDIEWLNARWLGLCLKRLNLTTMRRRVAKGVEVMLNVSKAEEKLKGIKEKDE